MKILVPFSQKRWPGIFWITFDRDMIESCGLRRWKEEMKMRRIVYYYFFWHGLLNGFNRYFWKHSYPVSCIQCVFNYLVSFQTANREFTRLCKVQMFRFNHLEVIDIIVEANRFSNNSSEKKTFSSFVFDKQLFFRHLEKLIKNFRK